MYRIAAVVTGSGFLAGLIATQNDRFKAFASSKDRNVEHGSHRKKWDFDWDKRHKQMESTDHGDSQAVEKPSATRTLLLVRHGQYEQWHDDRDKHVLTDLGREQARLTGERLKELNKPYTIIHHSTMPRAIETAQIISRSLPDVPLKSSDMLREGAPIRPEPPHKSWRPEEYEFFRDGARIEAAFRKYFHRASPNQKENSTEIIVCHANVIRYFICRALQLPPEAWLRMSLANGSITKVVIRPHGKVNLYELGNAGHMPPDKITFS